VSQGGDAFVLVGATGHESDLASSGLCAILMRALFLFTDDRHHTIDTERRACMEDHRECEEEAE